MGPGSQRSKGPGLALVSQGLRIGRLGAFSSQGMELSGAVCWLLRHLDVGIQATGTWRFASYDQSL